MLTKRCSTPGCKKARTVECGIVTTWGYCDEHFEAVFGPRDAWGFVLVRGANGMKRIREKPVQC